MEETYLLAMRCPVYRRRDSNLGFRAEPWSEGSRSPALSLIRVNWQQEELALSTEGGSLHWVARAG